MPLTLSLLIALLSAPSQPALPDARAWVSPSHTVTVTYAERSGDLRSATVRIEPRESARPAWRGDIVAVAFYGGEKYGWTIVDRLQPSERGAYEARALMPGPAEIQAFAIRTSGRESHVWISPSAYGTSSEPPKEPEPPADDPPGGPPAEPPGEPPADDPPPGDDGVRDPWGDDDDSGWDDGVRDPWGEQSISTTSLRFSI